MKIREVDINITNACNLHCVHCAFSSSSASRERIGYEDFVRCIEELCQLGLEDVHLTGGEPTMHPDIDRMIRFTVQKGLNVRLITNGYALSRQTLIRYRDHGLTSLMVSVDGLEQTHNRIRGKDDAFRKTIATVTAAKELGYNVRVNAVVSKLNIHEIKDLILAIAKLNVDVFSFFLYSPTGREAGSQLENVIGGLEWKNLVKSIRAEIRPDDVGRLQIAFEKGYYHFQDDKMDFPSYKGRGGGCFHLNAICDYLIILANGDVYPCALLTDKSIPYGNIHEDAIGRIVHHRAHLGVYQSFERPASKCATCSSWELCRGACKAFVYAHHGQWDKNDPRCDEAGADDGFIPLCPLHKENLFTGKESGYSELVVQE